MTENKTKPVTTEYFLKQMVFVVPAAKRNAILKSRKAEADASRAKFPGCDQAKVFAATMRDVSVQDLGRDRVAGLVVSAAAKVALKIKGARQQACCTRQ